MGVWIEIPPIVHCKNKSPVTPCVGVWIEINFDHKYSFTLTSLPAWECGLKSYAVLFDAQFICVTPCVGVWIEIRRDKNNSNRGPVTPCVGVWIEIINIRL